MMRVMMLATLLFPSIAVPTETLSAPTIGDVYQISSDRQSVSETNTGSSGTTSDRDTIVERIVAVKPDGIEVEYDVPENTAAGERAGNWQLPARIFKPFQGAPRLTNSTELAGRVDDWLKRGGLTRAACGKLIFTWNAFRIECDPQSALGILKLFDMGPNDLHDGALYEQAGALRSAPVSRTATGPHGSTYVVSLPLDPDVIRAERAQSDIDVATLMRKVLTIEEARRAHATENIFGTTTITFQTDASGTVKRRTNLTKLEIKGAGGQVETRTATQILERRQVIRQPSPNSI